MNNARYSLALLGFALSFVLIAPAFSQQAAPASSILEIKKMSPAKVQTPQYQLLKGQVMARTLTWWQLNVDYKTDPDWIDELTFTYYVLVKSKTTGKPALFKGDVTYVNIPKGLHRSDIYLHPSTLLRFGEVDRVGVQVSSQGRILALDGLPAGGPERWWEKVPLAPVDGLLLNRMQTPFAMINFDDYEAVKFSPR